MKSPLFEIKLDDSSVFFFKIGDGIKTFLARNPMVPDSDVGRALFDAVKQRAFAAARGEHKNGPPWFLEPKATAKARFPSEPRWPSSGRPTEFEMESGLTRCRFCGKPAMAGADVCYSCE